MKKPKVTPPLDPRIRELSDRLTLRVTQLGLHLAVFQDLLVAKGLVTESEVDSAIEKVTREAKEAMDAAAKRLLPPEDVQ